MYIPPPKASLDPSKISLGSGAIDSSILNELQQLAYKLKSDLLKELKGAVQLGSAAAAANGEAACNAQEDQAASTGMTAIGEFTGAAVGGVCDLKGMSGGPEGAEIEAKQATITECDDRETLIKNTPSEHAIVNNEAPKDALNQAIGNKANGKPVSAASKKTLANLKNTKSPLSEADKDSIGTLSQKQKNEALKSLQNERSEARKDVRLLQEKRSTRMNNWRSLGQVGQGTIKGTMGGLSSLEQYKQAGEEQKKVVFGWVTQSLQSVYQQISSQADSQVQLAQNDLKNLDDGQFHSRG